MYTDSESSEKMIHSIGGLKARHDTDRTVLSCPVWRCELSRPDRQTGAFCVWSGLCRSVSGGAVRPPDALRRRTQLSGSQFTEPYKTIDKTVAPASRPPPPRRRPGRPLRLAARTPTRSDVVRHAKCKHAVDCCI